MGLSGSLEIITVGLGTGKWEYHFTLFTLNHCIRDTLTGQSNINRTGFGGSDGAAEYAGHDSGLTGVPASIGEDEESEEESLHCLT